MRDFILTSASGEKIKENTQFMPFKLDRTSRMSPGHFEIKFLLQQRIYQYGFKLDNKKIVSEWLYFYPHKIKALLFERTLCKDNQLKLTGNEKPEIKYNYKFGNYLKGEKSKIMSLTRSNALYLTVGAQFAHPLLEKIFGWFSDFLKPGLSFSPGTASAGHLTTAMMETDNRMKKRILDFLKAADRGIEDIKIGELKKEIDGGQFEDVDIKMIHRAVSGSEEMVADIDFRHESMGTQRMYQLAGPLFDALHNGGVLLIDELEDSLHPHMLKTLLSEFFMHSSQSQIIFTTHNVHLLEEKFFRRDEIWFTEKKTDGSTELFSLSDFKPKPRKDKSLKNGYLNGAFGALPILGDLLGE